jgi:peptidoglycan/LPS O-acetylase OafA/YrhL
MTLAEPIRQEKGYEKYAWILVFVPSLIYGLLSLMPLIGGYYYVHSSGVINQAVPSSTPSVTINYLNVLARDDGLQGLFLGILLAVAATSYRKGQRLAWYVLFWFFVLSIATTILDASQPLPGLTLGGNVLVLVALVLSLLGLFLPYRKFFPNKRQVR